MKYVAIYTAVYAALVIAGWFSPNVSAAATFGLAHLMGLLMALAVWAADTAKAALREAEEREAYLTPGQTRNVDTAPWWRMGQMQAGSHVNGLCSARDGNAERGDAVAAPSEG